MELDQEPWKSASVINPYKGTKKYTRAAIRMPDSNEHFHELVCRIVGDLIHEGITKKVADDLYVGGNTVEELLYNWRRALDQFF